MASCELIFLRVQFGKCAVAPVNLWIRYCARCLVCETRFALDNMLVFRGVLCVRQAGRMLGAVVVGIGIAGRVRIRDMLAVLPGSPAEKITLRGFVSR